MKILDQQTLGKRENRFRDPPWDRDTPAWREIDGQLAADHLARRIARAVDLLDLGELEVSYGGRGSLAHRPELMLKAMLYEMECGKPSPAEWFRDAQENEAVKWLLFGLQPCRASLYEFRRRVIDRVLGWNGQVLDLAVEAGWVVAVRAALDGTTVPALASRHRLCGEKKLQKRVDALERVIEADRRGEAVQTPGWMAKHPETRLRQQEGYRKAQQEWLRLEAENQQRPSSSRQKREKIVVSPSEPEAALGLDKFRVFRPLYNVQLLRDLDTPFISAYDVFAQANDPGTLGPMLDRALEMAGRKPEVLLTDGSYTSGADVMLCDLHGVTLYAPLRDDEPRAKQRCRKRRPQISKREFTWLPELATYRCPEARLLVIKQCRQIQRFGGCSVGVTTYRCPAKYCRECPRREACTSSPQSGRTVTRLECEELMEQLRQRMETPEAKELYKLRRQTVELCYADSKEHRALRRFHSRGLRQARAHVGILVLIHNLLALLERVPPTKPEYQRAKIPEETPS